MQTPVEILKKYWGYTAFRPLQEDIILSVLNHVDTLALMPTGGGKSLCFQIPALLMEGVCVVISPLIALMKDQVEQLRGRNIAATAIYSGMSKTAIDATLDNCIYGEYKFLYLSPERLHNDMLLERVKQMKVCLLAIDEAHCVSQWGYDFRPAYLKIADFRAKLLHIPAIATTATATPLVKADILEKLTFKTPAVFIQSFARKNLSYSAFLVESKERKLFEILKNVQGSAVVYVRSRRRTQEIANWLVQNGILATFYHAGIAQKDRSQRQDDWLQNRQRIMVATNAFGMGIDKPDVRVVIHIDLPENLEAYYQEAGRAGRDQQKAYCVALYNALDIEHLKKNVEQNYPSPDVIRRVYQALANYFQLAVGSGELQSFEFDLQAFQSVFGFGIEAFYAIKKLEETGVLQMNEAYFRPSQLQILLNQHQLYDFQLRNVGLDSFIKLLLRIYGGDLFSRLLNISETAIAQQFRIPVSEVEALLVQLNNAQAVVYDKQKTKPVITFLTPRQEATRLIFGEQLLVARKALALEKAASVAHYVQHTMRCRTQLLLEYFGENSDQLCGICDNCLHKKKQQQIITVPQNEQKQAIMQRIAIQAIALPDLLASVRPAFQQEFIEVIRELLADGEIRYDFAGKLVLRKP